MNFIPLFLLKHSCEMKIIFVILTGILGIGPLISQILPGNASFELLSACEKSTSIHHFDFPNSKAALVQRPIYSTIKIKMLLSFHWGEIVKYSCLIKNSEIWLAGTDKDGNYKVAVAGRKNQYSDFYAGPLDINGQTNAETCKNWDNILSVNKENILTHIHNFELEIYNDTVNYKFILKM